MPAFCSDAAHALIRPMTPSTSSVSSAPRHRLLAALDDFAVVIHLPQPALGVVLRGRHDQDVLHALAVLGFDVEAVSDHDTPPVSVRRPAVGGSGFSNVHQGLGRTLL